MLKMVAFLDTSGIPMETELCLTSVLPTCPWQKSFCKARATASVDERLYRPGYCCRHTPLEEGYKNPGQDLSPTLKIHLGRRKDRKFCAGPLNEGKCIGMGSIQPLLQRGGEKASRCPTNVIDKQGGARIAPLGHCSSRSKEQHSWGGEERRMEIPDAVVGPDLPLSLRTKDICPVSLLSKSPCTLLAVPSFLRLHRW
ncbi:uncharacterized protein LOC135186333 isoform X3 [Pogoniulus pusillus]|uniref:uncharacterized protein LOC135186333 isoform X3 n=1 Tax=Pogoniulus pusillus TaxID=488313 RepID=UPI0030B98242